MLSHPKHPVSLGFSEVPKRRCCFQDQGASLQPAPLPYPTPSPCPSFSHEDAPRHDGDKEAPLRLLPSLGLPAACTTAISVPLEITRSLSALARVIHPQMQRCRALRSACCKILHLGDCLAQSHFSPGLLDSGDSPRAKQAASNAWS